jgi:rhodanese-related sulfurtransferase
MSELAPDGWDELFRRVAAGHVVMVDVRPGHAYARGHIPHSISAPYARMGWGRRLKNWLGPGASLTLAVVADNPVVANAARQALEQEGIAVGAVLDGGLGAWEARGLPLVAAVDVTADRLRQELDSWTVIDVREPYEWRSGVIPGAFRIPLGQLQERVSELDKNRRYAVVCATGSRSQAAAAYLADAGYEVANVVGGMSVWLAGRHPVERPAEEPRAWR